MGLLAPRDRRRLILVAAAQSSLALLDLLGIALVGVVAGLSASTLGGSIPSYLQGLADRAGSSDSDIARLALTLAAVAAFVLIGKSVLSFYIMRRTYAFLASRQARACGHLARRLLAKPLLEVQSRSSQETAYALTAGVNAIFLGILGSAVVVASESALLIVLGTGLALVDIWVCIFTIVFFLIVGLMVHRVLSKWAGRLGSRTREAEIASIVSVQEAVGTYRELAVSGRRTNYAARFERLRTAAANAQADTQVVNLVPKYVFEVMMVIGGGLLVASQISTRDTAAAVGIIAVYLAAASRIMPSMLRLQSGFITIRNSAGVADATYGLIADLETSEARERADDSGIDMPLSDATPHADSSGGFDSTLALDDVCFTFPGARDPALAHVTMRVPQGSSLAVVGPTGAGKSTFADVSMGLIAPDSGTVTIGGLSPQDAISRWPGAVGCVPQAVSVIEGSIRTNVALGLLPESVDDQDVWTALERSQLSSFLADQRDGLETVVGEHGVKLSGGQRQRLGLARALFSNPELVFLDEATSALDAETERAIADTLTGLAGRVTLVVIAHRLATVRHVDQVAYLEAGHLRALGTFEEVRSEVPDFDRQATLLGL
jgi:ABC-type multidrug transport system fused ATPase/permease subunit